MSDSAKKLTSLDDLVNHDHFSALKTLIVANSNAYPNEELFEILHEEQRIGPIWNQDLKAYVAQASDFPVACLVSQFAKDDWMPLLQHPFFQRRRPQLVARHELNEEKETYTLLREGKKVGPLHHEDVIQKLQNGDILISDQVSTDGGHTWGRLYEIEDFDRRSIVNSGTLPFMPEWQIFNNSFDEVETSLDKQTHNLKNLETDAIASLAYLENLQSGKATAYRPPVERRQSIEQPKPIPVGLIGLVAGLAVVLSLTAFLFSGHPDQTAEIVTPDNTVPTTQLQKANQRKNPTRIPSQRLGENVVREQKPIQEKIVNKVRSGNASSFRKSRAFVNQVEDNNDFSYDEDRPLEQDRIGKKLSKETVNPDDDYEREIASEGYDAEPNYADDRFGSQTKKAEDEFAKLYEDDSSVGEGGNSDQIGEEAYEEY